MTKSFFGKFGPLRERVGQVVNNIRDHGDDLGPAAPKALVRSVLRVEDKGSKSWPDGDRLFPNAIVIAMGDRPWEAYYSHMLADSASRIERAIIEHIARRGGSVQDVSVRIVNEPLLSGNQVRVTARFDETLADPIKTPRLLYEDKKARDALKTIVVIGDDGLVTDEVIAGVPTESLKSKATHDLNNAKEEPLDGIQNEGATASARLQYKDSHFVLRDGITIGATRYEGRKAPDISLPCSECPGTSHEHGRFDVKQRMWFYTNIGGNGTLLVRNDGNIPIQVDETQGLKDGDTLLLGCHEAEVSISIMDTQTT